VILEADTIPTEGQTTDSDYRILAIIIGSGPPNNSYNAGWQSFKQTTGASKILDNVDVKVQTVQSGTGSFTARFAVGLYDAKNGNQISSDVTLDISTTINATKNFDFSNQELEIKNNTTYWLKISASYPSYSFSGLNGSEARLRFNSAGGYADGQLDIIGTQTAIDVGDLYFTLTMTGDYFLTSGDLTTQIIDLGETPTADGEWKFTDITPSDYGTTAVTYTCYGSTDNFVTSNVTIGTKVDGDVIGSADWYQYYKIKLALTTTDKNETPSVQDVGLSFVSYVNYTNQKFLGYEESIHSVSSLTTVISDFELSTVGQISITLGLTATLSEYLDTKYPKNKPAKVLLGFMPDSGDTYSENDFLEYYSGVIEKYTINNHNVTINVKDPNQNWSVDVPIDTTTTAGKYTGGTFSNIVASADHHIDVMLDILQNQLNLRDAVIDFGSFESVKTTLSGWEVTRTIAGSDRQPAQDLLNELRVLTSTYFIFGNTGKIRLKLFNATESAVDNLTDDDFLTVPKYDAQLEEIINKTYISFDYNTVTDVFDHIWIGLDTTSIANWGETATKEIDDKWTDDDVGGQGEGQIETLSTNILTRYATPPAEIETSIDYRKLALEVGDVVTITTINAPSDDFAGITGVKYQIVNKNIDPNKYRLKMKFLRL
jgi:hypothetical protein